MLAASWRMLPNGGGGGEQRWLNELSLRRRLVANLDQGSRGQDHGGQFSQERIFFEDTAGVDGDEPVKHDRGALRCMGADKSFFPFILICFNK